VTAHLVHRAAPTQRANAPSVSVPKAPASASAHRPTRRLQLTDGTELLHQIHLVDQANAAVAHNQHHHAGGHRVLVELLLLTDRSALDVITRTDLLDQAACRHERRSHRGGHRRTRHSVLTTPRRSADALPATIRTQRASAAAVADHRETPPGDGHWSTRFLEFPQESRSRAGPRQRSRPA